MICLLGSQLWLVSMALLLAVSLHNYNALKDIQKDSMLEGKVCIEHVIFWWKTRSCAEKGARDRMLMAVIVLSHYTLLITWTIELLLKLDMIPWYVVCFMHESTQLNGTNV